MPCGSRCTNPISPQNTGTILRLCACLGVEAHIIEPAGFPVSDRAFRRAGMDYLDQVTFGGTPPGRPSRIGGNRDGCRLVLLTTRRTTSYLDHAFRTTMFCCLAANPRACPTRCITAADARLTIPMRPALRSLNVAMAVAMVTGEALRQTGGFPTIAADSLT